MARRCGLVLLVVVAVALAGTPAAGAQEQSDQYVALGDSFTAGPLIPNQLGDPYGCLHSDQNYPHLAAPAIGLPLRDVSCSGARTDHMTQPQNVDPDGPNPPQFDALDADTTVVTLGIGGNDIGFTDIALSCAAWHPFGSPCRNRYVVNGVDEISGRIAATAPKVASVIQGIRARAPQAQVYVVNYLPILPETGSGCWPQMPFAWNDVPYLRAKQKELNAMLAAQAAANGAVLVDAYSAGIGHDACRSSSQRWVEPVVPESSAAPVHPNRAGMQGTANVVVAAVGSG